MNKKKLFHIGIVLLITSISIISFASYQIYISHIKVKESLELWDNAVDHTNKSIETTKISKNEPNNIIGKLTINSIKLELPIIEGIDESSLEKGVVHYSESFFPGEKGNCLILGHRDTVFMPLKDIKVGDEININTASEKFTYFVDEVKVIEPDDNIILKKYDEPTLSLLTCYPFYYVGNAPQRFLVIAKIKS